MGIKVGICGLGGFAQCFVPLFNAHPLVDEVVLADPIAERRAETAQKNKLTRTLDSLDELCKSDVEAIAIMTQRHLHGPMILQALKAGKHVYSAVPVSYQIEEISDIMTEVKRSRLVYMMGETSYYYPSTLYCRQRFRQGDFGDFVYGEACYYHDMSHGFYDAFKHTGGDEWKQVAGYPPMYYPTHSVSMIASVTQARMNSVSCLGYRERHEDGIFREGGNQWDNPFSNETALLRSSDGGIVRINEFRRVGWVGNSCVHLSLFGTKGSYEEQANSNAWVTLNREEQEDLTDFLACSQGVSINDEISEGDEIARDFHSGITPVHNQSRLPKEFMGLPNGHLGSHQFLVDDFVNGVAKDLLPPNNIWDAARYMIPGIIAHESALKDGETLAIPDLGDAPEDWLRLDLDAGFEFATAEQGNC